MGVKLCRVEREKVSIYTYSMALYTIGGGFELALENNLSFEFSCTIPARMSFPFSSFSRELKRDYCRSVFHIMHKVFYPQGEKHISRTFR